MLRFAHLALIAGLRVRLGVLILVAVLLTGCKMGEPNQLAPSGGGVSPGTGSTAYSLGDRVQVGSEEYITLVDFQKGWTTSGTFFPPASGNQYVTFLVQLEGLDPSGASYNPLYFSVRDDQGFEYNTSIFGSREPQLQSGNDLSPGQMVKGWLTFEIPATATGATLVYKPNGGLGPQTVRFQVSLAASRATASPNRSGADLPTPGAKATPRASATSSPSPTRTRKPH